MTIPTRQYPNTRTEGDCLGGKPVVRWGMPSLTPTPTQPAVALLRDLAAHDGYGDLNEHSVDAITECLRLRLIKVVAAGPARNLRLTPLGKRTHGEL